MAFSYLGEPNNENRARLAALLRAMLAPRLGRVWAEPSRRLFLAVHAQYAVEA